jgi:hypothetical protein
MLLFPPAPVAPAAAAAAVPDSAEADGRADAVADAAADSVPSLLMSLHGSRDWLEKEGGTRLVLLQTLREERRAGSDELPALVRRPVEYDDVCEACCAEAAGAAVAAATAVVLVVLVVVGGGPDRPEVELRGLVPLDAGGVVVRDDVADIGAARLPAAAVKPTSLPVLSTLSVLARSGFADRSTERRMSTD